MPCTFFFNTTIQNKNKKKEQKKGKRNNSFDQMAWVDVYVAFGDLWLASIVTLLLARVPDWSEFQGSTEEKRTNAAKPETNSTSDNWSLP